MMTSITRRIKVRSQDKKKFSFRSRVPNRDQKYGPVYSVWGPGLFKIDRGVRIEHFSPCPCELINENIWTYLWT